MITLYQNFNKLDLNIYWFGDINNVCYSLIESAKYLNELNLMISSSSKIINLSKNIIKDLKNVKVTDEIDYDFLNKTDCVMTDVYESMNDKLDSKKVNSLKKYKIDKNLMSRTKDNCRFMHCLPTNYIEVEKDVLYGNKSLVLEQAKNWTLGQKRILQSLDWNDK